VHSILCIILPSWSYLEARRRQQHVLDLYLPCFVCFSSGSSSSSVFPCYWYSCFFSNSSELDHGSCGFERGSTVPLPCFLLPVLPSAHPSVSFLYSPCSFFLVCLRPPRLLSPLFFSLSFFPTLFFFSAVSLLSPPFFSPLCSILPLAFIARGCRSFLATK